VAHSEICLAVTPPERARDLKCKWGSDSNFPPIRDRAAKLESDPNLECALLYTSGTTGRPKGCRLSNAYFLRAGEWYAGLSGVCSVRRGKERIITPLPLNHVNAMAFSTMVV